MHAKHATDGPVHRTHVLAAPAIILDMEGNSPIVDLADRRTSDRDVVLLWGQRSGRFWVNVTHRRSGRMARINATAKNALDVFHHPFALRARGGVMHLTLAQSFAEISTTAAAWLMVRAGAAKGALSVKTAGHCAACRRRLNHGRCLCTGK